MPTSGAVPSATTSESADSASSPSESVSPESSSDYSSTNVQVEGVDESDVIKNDGEFIYMVSANVVRVIKAFPPEKMSEIAKVEMSDKNFQPSEIYVSDNKLVILGSNM